MKKLKYPFWYSLVFAIINLAEAVVIFIALGLAGPHWVFSFAAWYTKREMSAAIKAREANS